MHTGDKMIRLIVMDMDGTLLNSDNKISPKTKQILIRIQQQGIRLVLASGRSYRKLKPYALELQMQRYGGFLIEVNGMALYDLQKDERYVYKRMSKEQAQALFAYFRQWDVEFIGNFDDGMYDYNPPSILEEKKQYRIQHQIPDDYPWTGGPFHLLSDNRDGYPNIKYIQHGDEIDMPINKVSLTYHADRITDIYEKAKYALADRYWIGRTTKRWLEVMLPDITKGNRVKMLAKQLSLSLDEVMAFGDGENDIEMLEIVKYGIAMKNALPRVKQAAMDITGSHNEDGIVTAIHKYIKV